MLRSTRLLSSRCRAACHAGGCYSRLCAWTHAPPYLLGLGSMSRSRTDFERRRPLYLHGHFFSPTRRASPCDKGDRRFTSPPCPLRHDAATGAHGTECRFCLSPIARPARRVYRRRLLKSILPGRLITSLMRIYAEGVIRSMARAHWRARAAPMISAASRAGLERASGRLRVLTGRCTPRAFTSLSLFACRHAPQRLTALSIICRDGPASPFAASFTSQYFQHTLVSAISAINFRLAVTQFRPGCRGYI